MNTTFAADIAEMMAAWNTIMAAAKREFPGASDEKLYQIAKSAMNHSLKMEAA